jgi:hypothetical protein
MQGSIYLVNIVIVKVNVNQTLRKPAVLLLLLRQIRHPVYFPHCECARRFLFGRKRHVGFTGSFCCISQHRESPPQELEVRPPIVRANFCPYIRVCFYHGQFVIAMD